MFHMCKCTRIILSSSTSQDHQYFYQWLSSSSLSPAKFPVVFKGFSSLFLTSSTLQCWPIFSAASDDPSGSCQTHKCTSLIRIPQPFHSQNPTADCSGAGVRRIRALPSVCLVYAAHIESLLISIPYQSEVKFHCQFASPPPVFTEICCIGGSICILTTQEQAEQRGGGVTIHGGV